MRATLQNVMAGRAGIIGPEQTFRLRSFESGPADPSGGGRPILSGCFGLAVLEPMGEDGTEGAWAAVDGEARFLTVGPISNSELKFDCHFVIFKYKHAIC